MALTNLSITAFKAAIGVSEIEILRNPKTSKLFASASNGTVYRVQASLDTAKPIVVLMTDGDLSSACIINKSDKGAKLLMTL